VFTFSVERIKKWYKTVVMSLWQNLFLFVNPRHCMNRSWSFGKELLTEKSIKSNQMHNDLQQTLIQFQWALGPFCSSKPACLLQILAYA